MRQCLAVLALALGASASNVHKMKAAKRTRTIKNDRARVMKHLRTLYDRAPESHKADLLKELSTTVDYPEIESWYGYPLTLDWIVDVYFDSTLDTAYKVILDSGSSNLAIAVSSCSNCGDAATTLDLTETTPEMCIEVTYGSGSWSGVEIASTYVALSDEVYTDVTLAGITDQDEFFEGGSSYSGILGMAYVGIANSYESSECTSDDTSTTSTQKSVRKPSENSRVVDRGAAELTSSSSTSSGTTVAATPLMYALYENGNIDSNTFAVAMCGDYAEVSIGGVDSSLYSGDISYATTQKTFDEYYGYHLIYTSGVSVSSTAVTVTDINKYGGLVVDTGTTLHYLPTATVDAIETAVKTHYEASASSSLSTDFFEWSSCVESSTLTSFPTVTYTFATSDSDDATTFDVTLEPKHYLLEYDDCYYWGFEASTLGIFGNIGMLGRVMVFDITNTRIGIADGVCSSTDDTSAFAAKSKPKNLKAETASPRSFGVFGTGAAAVVAVAGTVMASAFVVLKKFGRQAAVTPETEALLPAL